MAYTGGGLCPAVGDTNAVDDDNDDDEGFIFLPDGIARIRTIEN